MLEKLKKKTYDSYLKYYQEPIDESLILLEAGQGKNINGNMFAILREIWENPRWRGLKTAFVVTRGTLEAARERFAFYHMEPELVVRNSERYCRLLATARYLLTDNSFPPFFLKREGQIYLNTWHGTPLKTLGKSDIANATSMANLQKNYLMSDYALFPNEFTRDVFMKDYMLENLYRGQVVLCDYPRNSIFLNTEYAVSLRKTLGLEGKQLIAYMPTWRGANRKAEISRQKQILEEYFSCIDQLLEDDQIFYVNLHFLVGNTMDFQEYAHIRPFPPEYETYDFLSVCDMLVTDYSSVFFDFAVTGRKIILFPYDLEEYMENRGTYFPIQKLPFPIVYDGEALAAEIGRRDQIPDRKEFLDTYCAYRDPRVPERILELLTEGRSGAVKLEKGPHNGKELLLFYGGKLADPHLNRYILEELERLAADGEKNVVLAFTGNFSPRIVELLQQLPEGVNFLNLVSEYNFPRRDRLQAALALRVRQFQRRADRRLLPDYEREGRRLFSGIRPDKTVNFSGLPNYMYKILATLPGEKEAHIHSGSIRGLAGSSRSSRLMNDLLPGLYQRVEDHRQEDMSRFWEEEKRGSYYNGCCRIDNLSVRFGNKEDRLCLRAVASIKTTLPFSHTELKFQIGEKLYDVRMKKGLRIGRRRRIASYRLEVPCEDLAGMQASNKVFAVYRDELDRGLHISIGYLSRRRDKRKWRKGPIRYMPESNTSAYFRQSVKNRLYLSVRTANPTDSRKEQFKLFLAYHAARLFPGKERVLLFEKNGSRYEESASVLYEKLVDAGYRNVAFLLDRNYPYYSQIPEKYRKYLVDKCSFRHYLYFFRGKTFIGTETLVHAIDLRVDNKYAREKLAAKNINYVFLQHGVMYMVSLDSESRTFFKPRRMKGKFRVVVSSQEEARHFVELGKYNPETLYVCGLPKFDRSSREPEADRIVIMPTWRPWEYNEARFDFTQTRYYQMLERMFAAVPGKLRDRVVILPHPLFYEAAKNEEFALKQYMDCDSKYDTILRRTRILVTDYSSIAYDAFYRGANVIFYWEEKDECMEHYGPSTKLMLNEENVYGDICYNGEELSRALLENDREGQKESYMENYRKLVEFHDGRNTERLLEMLQEDGLLKKERA